MVRVRSHIRRSLIGIMAIAIISSIFSLVNAQEPPYIENVYIDIWRDVVIRDMEVTREYLLNHIEIVSTRFFGSDMKLDLIYYNGWFQTSIEDRLPVKASDGRWLTKEEIMNANTYHYFGLKEVDTIVDQNIAYSSLEQCCIMKGCTSEGPIETFLGSSKETLGIPSLSQRSEIDKNSNKCMNAIVELETGEHNCYDTPCYISGIATTKGIVFDFGLWLVRNIGCTDEFGNPIESVVPCKEWNLFWPIVTFVIISLTQKKKIQKMLR